MADPAPHVSRIHILVNKIWPLGNNNIKIDVFPVNERTVKFQIRDELTRKRILRWGMWNIAGIPLIVSKWSPADEEEDEDEQEIKILPMWVTLKNVPRKLYSWKGIGFIASSVGKPVRLHPETELCSNFEEAKVFVNADMAKELPKVYKFKSKKGISAAVEFSYPWLPKKCSFCSKWGHPGKECTKSRAKESLVAGDQSVGSPEKTINTEIVIMKEPKERMKEVETREEPKEKEFSEVQEVEEFKE